MPNELSDIFQGLSFISGKSQEISLKIKSNSTSKKATYKEN